MSICKVEPVDHEDLQTSDTFKMSNLNAQPADGLFREAAPRHYLLKVESFSLLARKSIVKYESNAFEAEGHKWKIVLYPDGNKNENGNGYVSLYLELVDTSSLPACGELNVFFRLFLFDQIQDRYLVHGDIEGRTRRFHVMKKVWGFPQFASHGKFNDASNGYLVDDTCAFGAEVFISKSTGNCERLSILKLEQKEGLGKQAIQKMSFRKVEPVDHDGLFREAAPLHYLFKVELIPPLSKKSIVKYESNAFEAEGHKWRIVLYPDGNKNENGNGHVSLYLELVDTSSLPACGELNVFFRLFLFDHIRDRYLVRGDIEGRTRRFHVMKTVWGFPQFVSHGKFNDASNGYLVDDICVFGAEVFITKPTGNCERLSMVKVETTVHHTWKIHNLSKIKEEYLYSDVFKVGDQNWNLIVYPKGYSMGSKNSLSLFLNLSGCENNPSLKVYAEFKLRLRDQVNGNHVELSTVQWFSAASKSLGWAMFVKLDVLNKKSKGLLFKGTCIVEAEVKVMGIVSKLP